MNFDTSNKNYSGLAFVAVLHLAVAGYIATHSKISIFHPDPAEIILVPNKDVPPPPPQVDPVDPPELPATKLPVVIPPMIEAPTLIEPTITTRPADPHVISDPGPSDPGKLPVALEPPRKAAPVNVAAVIDAASCAKPAYPASALRNGDEGTVTLAFLVGKDGRVASAKVEHTSGNRDLDRAALQGLSMCAFKPGTIDGVAQESWARMQYAWRLD
ncbi:TonB family protein [Pseudoduganella eburnea]|uniref:Protein TonB n=1 Tax=Massilia eburnea TaxID=1776165 RepID=A0A6L6QI08_9BURK|nr:energy transducer TonB [Massilia eburnea]MTW11547.1 TonB family protein [Massilia eburnea]